MIAIVALLGVVTGTHITVISENDQEAKLEFIDSVSKYKLSVTGGQTQVCLDDESLIVFDGELNINVDVTAQNDLVMASFDSRIEYNGINQMVLLSIDGFDQQVDGWSDSRTSLCGTSSNKFLGGPCLFSKMPVTRIYEDLPEHEQLLITYNFHFFDEWEGEYASLMVDGSEVWQESYSWCEKVMPWMCYKFGINVCGNHPPDQFGQSYQVLVQHQSSTLTLQFSTTLGAKDACTASWGIDNVALYLL